MPQASQDLGELLQRHGIRATPNRLLVLQELAREPDDVTAQELWGRLREGNHTTGLATVYRTLALLNDAGWSTRSRITPAGSSATGCAARLTITTSSASAAIASSKSRSATSTAG